MTKVSVIIPLYNSARFLPFLFENIAQQTIAADCEFVFVDDHGGDDSLAVAQSLAAASFLRCIFTATEANGGPGAARNAGMAAASGEYIAFLDSDDALDPTFCEKLYDAAAGCDADLAYCHILALNEGTKGDGAKDAGCRDSAGGKAQSAVWRNPAVTGGDFSDGKRIYFLRRYKSYFTSFIYRRAMLIREGITFPPTRSAEDSCFLACALLCARSIAMVDEPLYHYRLRCDSVSKVKDEGRCRQRLESFKALLDFAKEKGLYDRYRGILNYIRFKKGTLGALRDRLKF